MNKLTIAKTAGFCMGVKRAVDMVLELLKTTDSIVYTYGPLIHNPQVIDLLTKKGVIVINNEELPKEGTIVVRTHGVHPQIRKKIHNAGLAVYDATCPFVVKVQRIIEEYRNKGYEILIIGDKGHAEVDSYIGYADNKGKVISSVKELGGFFNCGKLCVVAQTTQDRKKFNGIIEALKEYKGELKIFDTICNATNERQKEAYDISKIVDAMIVIGGKNSANTQRLYEICKATGTPSFFVESAKEIDFKALGHYSSIGITAGASTSKETIQEVADILNEKYKN